MSVSESSELVLAIPSKGRLKEQVEAWLEGCGLRLVQLGGGRGYSAEIKGLPGVQVRLASAGDIASAIEAGEVHLGITGEDLLRERALEFEDFGLSLSRLGFGRADLVVAVPRSWLDVETMADLDDVAHAHMARTGRRLRVGTKYLMQTRRYFAVHGVAEYRLVESSGATEGAPAAGLAEIIVDITTTGATLADNGLKILRDGLILRSEANLVASLTARWSHAALEVALGLLQRIDARDQALEHFKVEGLPAEVGDYPTIGDARLIRAGDFDRQLDRLSDGGAFKLSASRIERLSLGPAASGEVLKARLGHIF